MKLCYTSSWPSLCSDHSCAHPGPLSCCGPPGLRFSNGVVVSLRNPRDTQCRRESRDRARLRVRLEGINQIDLRAVQERHQNLSTRADCNVFDPCNHVILIQLPNGIATIAVLAWCGWLLTKNLNCPKEQYCQEIIEMHDRGQMLQASSKRRKLRCSLHQCIYSADSGREHVCAYSLLRSASCGHTIEPATPS